MVFSLSRQLLDWCFPPSKEREVVSNLTTEKIAELYNPRVVDGIEVLLPYRHEAIRALIHEAKYHHNTQAHILLAEALATYIRPYIRGDTLPLFIPIPLHPRRQRERGYNQITEILKHLEANVDTDILLRTRHTPPQTTLKRNERLQNMKNAFSISKSKKDIPKDVPFFLIDDVMTTGTTLKEAKHILREHYPNPITCIALAH